MIERFPDEARIIMNERFGRDSLMALATVEGGLPRVRTVNAYYEDGCFYVITHARSGKMRQIAAEPRLALCGDWFTAQGVGENMGWIRKPENAALAGKLRTAFASWYGNGHVNEADPDTCILRIRLTSGVLMNQGTRYEIDFS